MFQAVLLGRSVAGRPITVLSETRICPYADAMNEIKSIHAGSALTEDPLLQPFALRGVTIRNRIFSTGHALSHAMGGKPTAQTLHYQMEKAKGGIGLSFVGGSSTISADTAPRGASPIESLASISPDLKLAILLESTCSGNR